MAKLCSGCGGPVCPTCGGCINEGECACSASWQSPGCEALEAENQQLRAKLAELQDRIQQLGGEVNEQATRACRAEEEVERLIEALVATSEQLAGWSMNDGPLNPGWRQRNGPDPDTLDWLEHKIHEALALSGVFLDGDDDDSD